MRLETWGMRTLARSLREGAVARQRLSNSLAVRTSYRVSIRRELGGPCLVKKHQAARPNFLLHQRALSTSPSGGGNDNKPKADDDDESENDKIKVRPWSNRWGIVPGFVANILATFADLVLHWKRERMTTKEVAEKFGFAEEDIVEGCKTAYMRVANVFTKGEPVFKSQYSDMVHPMIGEVLDAQLESGRENHEVPRLIVGQVNARFLFMERGIRSSSSKFDDWMRLAEEAKQKGEEFVIENVAPTVLTCWVLFEAKEAFDWLPMGKEASWPASVMSNRKHLAVFVADVPLGIMPGKEADNVDFRLYMMV